MKSQRSAAPIEFTFCGCTPEFKRELRKMLADPVKREKFRAALKKLRDSVAARVDEFGGRRVPLAHARGSVTGGRDA